MSRETRTIRPFVGIDDFADVLDGAVLYFGQEACLASEGATVSLSPHEFVLRPVSIAWGPDDEAFERFKERLDEGVNAAGIAAEDLSLVVIVSSPFIKVSEVVYEGSVSDLESLRRVTNLTEDRRSSAFSAPFNGFAVDAYVLLSRSLAPKVLRPHVRGTWLASVRFRIETTYAPAVLSPTPLTDEVRAQYQLGAKTIRYLYFGDHDVLQPYAQQERPVFYIDEKLLAQMNVRRRSAASRALQLQLAQDFASAVVRRASARSEPLDLGVDDLRTSLLGSVIRIAAGPGSTDQDRARILSQVSESPEYVIARTEHMIDVGSGYGSMLKDDES